MRKTDMSASAPPCGIKWTCVSFFFEFEFDPWRCCSGRVKYIYIYTNPPPPQLEEAERQRLADIKQAERKKADDEMDVIARGSAGSSSAAAAGGKTVPPVRAPAKISVKFSERAFRTPGRESYKAEEDEVGAVSDACMLPCLSVRCASHTLFCGPPFFLITSGWQSRPPPARP